MLSYGGLTFRWSIAQCGTHAHKQNSATTCTVKLIGNCSCVRAEAGSKVRSRFGTMRKRWDEVGVCVW